VPFEKVLLVKIGLPPPVLFEVIYRLGRLGKVVFIDRPEPFAPAPPLSDVERSLEVLNGFFTLLGVEGGGAGLSENRLLTEMLDSAAAAIRQCVKKLERGDVVAETLSKKEVVDCVQDLGWSLDALFTPRRYATWTLEIYEKSAYSEGPETGRQFISLEKELLAREAELRKLQALYKFLRAVPRGVSVPRGYQIVINPTKLVTTPHEKIQVEDLEVYITAEGDSYGGVVVPPDYMNDPKLAIQLVSQALRSTEESLRKLRKTYKGIRDLYLKFSAFGDFNWKREVATVAFYVLEKDMKLVDEVVASVVAKFYVATSFSYRLEVSTKFIYTEEAPRAERWPRPLQAFTTLVYWMGAPGPKELSPVPLVAVLFPLYFGWMFGDVGHGLLLALFAVLLYKLGKRDWAWIWGFAAVSAVLFGLYYGEAFGISFRDGEEAVTPLEGIASAVLFGFTVLLIAFILKVVNLVIRGDHYVAVGLHVPLILLFTATGASLLGVIRVPEILHSKPGIWLVSPLPSLGPALALLGLAWLAASILYGKIRHVGEVSVLLSELPAALIEVLIASSANLFSFVRLEMLHIIHATLTQLSLKALQLPGGIVLVVFLQLLIILGEGFFASVQSLRLLYYETLTKFYEGSGRVFKPHKIPP
jgi:V/A-type H+-transporting ATPase subunit I